MLDGFFFKREDRLVLNTRYIESMTTPEFAKKMLKLIGSEMPFVWEMKLGTRQPRKIVQAVYFKLKRRGNYFSFIWSTKEGRLIFSREDRHGVWHKVAEYAIEKELKTYGME